MLVALINNESSTSKEIERVDSPKDCGVILLRQEGLKAFHTEFTEGKLATTENTEKTAGDSL